MRDYILPLFVCDDCGRKLYTWEAAAKAEREGCPCCKGDFR